DHLFEGVLGRIPIGDVADRGVELVAVVLLLGKPLREVARGAATRDDRVTDVMELAADRGADPAHSTCHVCDFLRHFAVPPGRSSLGGAWDPASWGPRSGRCTDHSAFSLTYLPGAGSIGWYRVLPGCA